jgi:hypothetical protein
MKLYYLYILASIKRVLYIGVTGNFEQRLAEHRSHLYPNALTAQKVALIERLNAEWEDRAPLPPRSLDSRSG